MTKLLTVKQVAKLSGVSVRALHHYDEIGLLKPASIGRNRYRYYGQDELLRLQQILLHRELDFPLGEIGVILDDPDFDQLAALHRQRDKLAGQAKRYARLVRTVDRTIASLKGDETMRNAELYKGISPEKQAEYEAWLIDRYGGDLPQHITSSRKKYEALGEVEKTARRVGGGRARLGRCDDGRRSTRERGARSIVAAASSVGCRNVGPSVPAWRLSRAGRSASGPPRLRCPLRENRRGFLELSRRLDESLCPTTQRLGRCRPTQNRRALEPR